MPPEWILLAALSAVFLGVYDLAKKFAVDRFHPLAVLLQGSLAGMVVILVPWCGTVWGVLPENSKWFVHSLSAGQHALVLLKSTIVSASWVCSYMAIRQLPLSLAGPIRASAPLFTVLGAVLLLGERLRVLQWVGMASIFIGYVGLSRTGRKEGIEWTKSSALALLFVATLLGAASALYDKHLLGQLDLPATTVQFWFCVYNVLLQALAVAEFVRREKLSVTECLHPSRLALVTGVSLLVADQLYFRALAEEGALIAVVSMTRRSNVLISFVVGGLILRETFLIQKAKMLCLVLAGVVLLFL